MKIARAAAAIASGRDHDLVLGDLDARRDWCAAVDYVAALERMALQDRGSDYVIATGVSLAVRDLLDIATVSVADLSVGEQQRVEILKALHHGARVLILDEPTAVLTPQEVDELFAVLRTLREAGTTIVLITHKLAEVKALADRVTIMRAGRVVGGGAVADFSIDALAELMVGRVPAPLGARADRAPGGGS